MGNFIVQIADLRGGPSLPCEPPSRALACQEVLHTIHFEERKWKWRGATPTKREGSSSLGGDLCWPAAHLRFRIAGQVCLQSGQGSSRDFSGPGLALGLQSQIPSVWQAVGRVLSQDCSDLPAALGLAPAPPTGAEILISFIMCIRC